MKLSVAYNIFDGIETLEDSLTSIRSHVDRVAVIFQDISNFGSPADERMLPFLKELKNDGMIDIIYGYKPKDIHAQLNECNKRNYGIIDAYENECTHHLTIDADEIYETSQFKEAKDRIIKEDADGSVCKMLTYYGDKEHVFDPPETYYVPFIYRIYDNRQFINNCNFPYFVDPTRRIPNCNHIIEFKRDELQMHHFSYVRESIESKINNSTARHNWKEADMKFIIDFHSNWNPSINHGYVPEYNHCKKVMLRKVKAPC